MNDADYCVLSPRSTTYKDLYTRTLKARRPPLGYGWLEECDKEGEILPPEQWLLETHGRLVHPVTAARFAIEDEDSVDSPSSGDGDSNMLYVSRSSNSSALSSWFTSNSKDSRDNRLMEEAIVQLFAEDPTANSRKIFEKIHHLVCSLIWGFAYCSADGEFSSTRNTAWLSSRCIICLISPAFNKIFPDSALSRTQTLEARFQMPQHLTIRGITCWTSINHDLLHQQ